MVSLALSYTPSCTLHGTCFVYRDMTHTPAHLKPTCASSTATCSPPNSRPWEISTAGLPSSGRRTISKHLKKHKCFYLLFSERVQIWVSAVFLFFSIDCFVSLIGVKSLGGVTAAGKSKRDFLVFSLSLSLSGLQRDWTLAKNSRRQGENDEMRSGHDLHRPKAPKSVFVLGNGKLSSLRHVRGRIPPALSLHTWHALSELIASLRGREWDG